jgi:transcriptional regulator with XRE-family HTH domain
MTPMAGIAAITSVTMDRVGAQLRAIRKQQGMTLQEVEKRSKGFWKAVVVGSYERNDRTLSLKKAIGLADFYQIPLQELLGLPAVKSPTISNTIIIDLRALNNRYRDTTELTNIHNFALLICAKRRDWNGEILSLRITDITTLALILFCTESELMAKLIKENLLFLKS